MRTIDLTSIPAPIVTLDEALNQTNCTSGQDEDLHNQLIAAACAKVERDAELYLGERSVVIRWAAYPCLEREGSVWGAIELPVTVRPIASIDAVRYRGSDRELHSVDLAQMQFSLVSRPVHIAMLPQYPLPQVVLGYFDSFVVECTAGLSEDCVAMRIAKQAVLLLIGHWYLNREAVVTGTISSEITLAYKSLIDSLKLVRAL